MSRDTWAADLRTEAPVEAVLGWLDSLSGPVDGITISGGEPFEQPTAVAELLRGVHAWRGDAPVDILIFSGYTYSHLSRDTESQKILELCDAVVAGPYVDRRNDGSPLRGSSNQRLVPLTDLGRERYEARPDVAASPEQDKHIQVGVNDGPEGRRVYYIGIPRRGDMDQLSSALERAGVRAGEVSWR
jgi:anaerobic ribonucleoside-triphosphate reductase activating protein